MAILYAAYEVAGGLPLVKTLVNAPPHSVTLEASTCFSTGAAFTSISPRFAKALGAEPHLSTRFVPTADGVSKVQSADIDIYLEAQTQPIRKEVVIAEGQTVDLIIGMDVIPMGDLALMYKDGRHRLIFYVPRI